MFGFLQNMFGGGSSNSNPMGGIDWFTNLPSDAQTNLLKNPENLKALMSTFGSGTDTGGLSMFGGDQGGGLLGGVMGGLGTLGDLYGAYKSLGLMNDQLDFQKDAFNYQKQFAEREYQNRSKDMNRQLEDRQKARLSADPQRLQSYDSLDSYMSKHKV